MYKRQENKLVKVKSYEDEAIDTVWWIYGISIFCLVFYMNVVPGVTDKILHKNGIELLQKNIESGNETKHFSTFLLSSFSLFFILNALPTMVPGFFNKIKHWLLNTSSCV